MIRSYLSKRYTETRCRVSQGSVLGPTLWSVCYDQVLRMEMMEGKYTIAYFDDLAVVVRAASGTMDLKSRLGLVTEATDEPL
ncbi:hypothetical protein GWI33_017601 [Rhynchophorus ferrugineus]|uniref:Reverse transcriptase domain-containing protein n=1 Tax=Rhynchophorus ferrugineus TaxID=354439 RepID=A0A834HZC0_RHYFE|nr:hypothetical protein GWI33_017601 [Rhynchophorus ferrugineus]